MISWNIRVLKAVRATIIFTRAEEAVHMLALDLAIV